MAKGLSCRECGEIMYADEEDYEPKGTTVVYVCRNGSCPSVINGRPWKEKKFESNE